MKKAAPEWGAAESAKQNSDLLNSTSARLLPEPNVIVIEGGRP